MKTLFKLICLGTLIFSFSASAAEQVFQCSFDKECIGTEACADTTFSLSLEKMGGAPSILGDALVSTVPTHQIVTDAETLPAHSFTSQDKKVLGFWLSRSNGDFQSLTIAQDGMARYSIHMPTSELAIFYRGTCRTPS